MINVKSEEKEFKVRAAVAACAPAMSTVQTHDTPAETPQDTEFWSKVAAVQAADDADDDAIDSEVNKPYRLFQND